MEIHGFPDMRATCIVAYEQDGSMSCWQAANPGACMQAFIRAYSVKEQLV